MLNGPVHKDGFVFVFDWKKVYSVRAPNFSQYPLITK